nr:hypothetical protein [Tanacetum cinerariifolium]
MSVDGASLSIQERCRVGSVVGPLLIDGSLKAFSIDKATGKKCYTLSARELYVAWSANPQFWCWKTVIQSRRLIGSVSEGRAGADCEGAFVGVGR